MEILGFLNFMQDVRPQQRFRDVTLSLGEQYFSLPYFNLQYCIMLQKAFVYRLYISTLTGFSGQTSHQNPVKTFWIILRCAENKTPIWH